MSLVGELRKFEDLPEYLQLDRDTEMRNFLEEQRSEYPLLNEAIQRRTTFEEKVNEAYKPFAGLRSFFPTRKNGDQDQRVDELEGLIGCAGLLRTGNKQENKTAFSSILLKWAGIPTAIAAVTEYVSTGRVGPVTGFIGIVSGLFSSVAGLQSTGITSDFRSSIKGDAKYLDKTIQRVYASPKKSEVTL